MASAGVCIISAIFPCSPVMNKVAATPMMANSHIAEPIVAAASRSFFAPVAMPISTVMPVVRPRIMPVMVCIT